MKRTIILVAAFVFFHLSSFGQDSSVITVAGIEFIKVPAGNFVYGKFQPVYPQPSKGGEYHGYRTKDYTLARKLALRDRREGFAVAIKRAFYLGKFEITQQQWKTMMDDNPSFFKGDNFPADNITWDDAQRFIKKLNEKYPQYRFRLPSEFEWEYAARAGATDDISWDEIRLQAQLGTTTTNSVGGKKANAWGFFDMLGNVWEWTSDWYNEKIFADSVPLPSGKNHVLKGASFTGDVKNATYMTHAAGPGNGWDIGFRILMEEKGISDAKQTPSLLHHKKANTNYNGWHLSRTSHQGTTPDVKIKHGVITLEQNPYGQGGILLSNKKYRDFELTVDVKIDSFCNGGIFLRSTESGQAYQIELSEPGGTGNLFGEMMKISVPGNAKNKSKVWKPNDWNTFRIRMTGKIPRIVLWINGELMWDVTQPRNDFTAGATEGMIGFQVHWSSTYSAAAKGFDMSSSWRPGGRHRFRNIVIKEL